MNQVQLKTREKILLTAHKLFAENGVKGVSMRQIAQSADVPLSAINYHFKSKNLLFFEVYKFSYERLDQSVSDMADQVFKNKAVGAFYYTKELIKSLSGFFEANRPSFMNSFKMTVIDNSEFNDLGDETLLDPPSMSHYGPPGGKYLLMAIMKDLGLEGEPSIKHRWAMRCIFGHLVHFTVIRNCLFVKYKSGDDSKYLTDPKVREKELFELIEALLFYLQK